EMREGLKDDRYNLRMPPPEPLVPRSRRLGVRERMRFDGTVTTPLDRRALASALKTLDRAAVEAVAVCYLHAYRNPRHERETGRAVARRRPGLYVSLSSEVLPQIKEYERVWTTVVNAYVGPALARYLSTLTTRLRNAGYRVVMRAGTARGSEAAKDVLIMQSHGGVAPIRESARLAAGAVLSGPAGGVAAGRHVARLIDHGDLVTFDMGGTSTDIALLQGGEPTLTGEKTVGMARVALPSLDIHTLGAGGGSIARVDAGRILHVGPESAGADPGPACYGQGGTAPTVTDANLVRGLLDPANFLGGRIALDVAAARRAMETIAKALGTDAFTAAEGIGQVVNTNMAEGIKLVSVRRGVDPRGFTLVAFGGAAGLHVTEVARLLEIRRVIVPSVAAVLSAWGMLATDLRYEVVRTHIGDARRVDAESLKAVFGEMEAEGRRRLAEVFDGPVVVHRAADMRYGEQIFEIGVPLDGVNWAAPDPMQDVVARFHRRHEELYTYSVPDQEVVLVNARVAVVGRLPALPQEPTVPSRPRAAARARRRIYLGEWMEVPIFDLDAFAPGQVVEGPTVVESATTTVLLRPGERGLVTPLGWLDIKVARAE
ncbi:MAG: hydantoinase/oxoprolinase family protein, partial [Thermoanaerobaculia bacterium]